MSLDVSAVRLETSESVCAGHPDKVCDRIADEILDWCLWEDPTSRVAVEVMASRRRITVAGQITCRVRVPVRQIVRTTLAKLGYEPWRYRVSVNITRQSVDIAGGVDAALETRADAGAVLGAGDQGTVYGYATDATPFRLPVSLVVAHQICERLDAARTTGAINGIGPDGKAQATLTVDPDGKPLGVTALVVSIQHAPDKDPAVLRREVLDQVITPVLTANHLKLTDTSVVLVNPSGRFVSGGPDADTGMTGRKLMVDSYGGHGQHGGGAFSGKDATKVDRSAAYMARYLARLVVDAGLAKRCTIGISYAIGKADPLAFTLDTHGTATTGVSDQQIRDVLASCFSLRPGAIITFLRLDQPIYARTSAYGHFPADTRVFPWETTADASFPLFQEVTNQ